MTLDDLSQGRFTLGIGAGGTGFDATVLGQDLISPGERIARLAEFTGLLDQLLTQQATTSHRERYTAVDARMVPGCVQQPGSLSSSPRTALRVWRSPRSTGRAGPPRERPIPSTDSRRGGRVYES